MDRSVEDLNKLQELRRQEALVEKRFNIAMCVTCAVLCIFMVVAAICLVAKTYIEVKGG